MTSNTESMREKFEAAYEAIDRLTTTHETAWLIWQAATAAALQSAPEDRDAQRWQPIETAPKDGSTVIVGRDMGDFGFVRGYARFEGAPGAFCSGWISHGFNEFQGNLGLAHPTHWMPLPAAPGAAMKA